MDIITLINALSTIIATASAFSTFLPKGIDGSLLSKLKKVIDVIAMNFGNAGTHAASKKEDTPNDIINKQLNNS